MSSVSWNSGLDDTTTRRTNRFHLQRPRGHLHRITHHDVSLNCFRVLNFGIVAPADASSPPFFAAFSTFFSRDSFPPFRFKHWLVSFSMLRAIAAVSFCKAQPTTTKDFVRASSSSERLRRRWRCNQTHPVLVVGGHERLLFRLVDASFSSKRRGEGELAAESGRRTGKTRKECKAVARTYIPCSFYAASRRSRVTSASSSSRAFASLAPFFQGRSAAVRVRSTG